MVKDVVLYKCDRCGTEETYKEDVDAKVKGWCKIRGKDLCPDCSYEYEEFINKFFNVDKKKEEE